jgi:hypothetical protein
MSKKSVKEEFQEARDALWDIQRKLEEDGLSSPGSISSVVALNRLLDTAEEEYEAKQKVGKEQPDHAE